MKSPPFRTYLRPTPPDPSNRAAIEERMRLYRALADWNARSDALLPVLEMEDEEVHYLVALHHSKLSYAASGAGEDLKLGMATRALQVARREGVCWTPVIDQLAIRRALVRSRPGTAPDGQSLEIPTATELAMEMKGWIKAQDDGAQLLPLLDFSSHEVHAVVAGFARALDPAVFSGLLALPHTWTSLARNDALAPDQHETLFRTAWDYHLDEKNKERPPEYQVQRVVQTLAEREPGIPDDLRTRWIASERRRKNNRAHVLAALARDVGAPGEVVVPLLGRMSPGLIAEMVGKGRLDLEQLGEELDRRGVAEAIIDKPTVPEEFIEEIARRHGKDPRLAQPLIRHVNVTVSALRAVAERTATPEIQLALLGHWEGGRDPEVRQSVTARSEAPRVLEQLLPDADAGDYGTLMSRLLQKSPITAVEAATRTPPPEGTLIDPASLASALSTLERERRMQAITLLGAHTDRPVRREQGPRRQG